MRFLIVSPVIHKSASNGFAGYTPYIREMNLWLNHVDEVVVAAPSVNEKPDPLESFYDHPRLRFVKLPAIDTTSFPKLLISIVAVPVIFFRLFREMIHADHIHLRCPSNMGLLGSIVQLFFPWKPKTVKYANNWDWQSEQPLTYRIQQWILRNSLLTHNAKVLVYGDWNERSRNIVPFFTASYSQKMALPVEIREITKEVPVKMLFVGTLTPNKRPLLAIQVLEQIRRNGIDAQLTLLGDGFQRDEIQDFIENKKLSAFVHLKGKVSPDGVIEYFKESHFLVFLSQSEGWPKVVAESMWWGCLPVTTNVSCVKQMIGDGTRGVLVEPEQEVVVKSIEELIQKPVKYKTLCEAAMKWSRLYHLERFEEEIVKLLNPAS
ncbi:glycosyltransferase [Alkalitalea saponilacus]|uniref:Glycosyltransferase involved in cell wall bisynthesis n=1 Tax=Alkalitalea saponilacus TaxID=889453 RepID=A0A1T5HS57_9BACT|nr:glycosyltransferase [Alkalitalea saponilacus]ASB48300.1 glycosyl transferase [Alkalitalea saponilacus]SKC23523.1 Glycosyltransferase involved in cell wall bisynthesis [Alkalitalea saponilacus]